MVRALLLVAFSIGAASICLEDLSASPAEVNRQTWWLTKTSGSDCRPDVTASFELGNGSRWLVSVRPLEVQTAESNQIVRLSQGEVLAFVESVGSKRILPHSKVIDSAPSKFAIVASRNDLESWEHLHNGYVKIIEAGEKKLQCNPKTSKTTAKSLKVISQPLAVDHQNLLKNLREFSGDLDVDGVKLSERGSERGRAAGRAYITKRFTEAGLTVEEQCFNVRAGKGCNVVGVLPGKSADVLVVSAHADSVNNAGADDDGSGVAAMIEIANLVRSKAVNSTIHFVAFDLEEKGLIGSREYVKEQLKRNIHMVGNFNLEMLGYEGDGQKVFHIIDCQRPDSAEMVNYVRNITTTHFSDLSATTYCTNRSDHASFWDAGIPALVISQDFFGGDGNPCYHASCDKFNRINPAYYQRLADLAATSIAGFVGQN